MRRGEDLQYEIEITLEQAAEGYAKPKFSFLPGQKCEECDGTGAKKGTKPKTMSDLSWRRQRRVGAVSSKLNKLVLPVMEKVPSSISRVRNVMEQAGRKKGRRFRFKFLRGIGRRSEDSSCRPRVSW